MPQGCFEGKMGPHKCNAIAFQKDEAHFLEAAYFDELAEDGEIVTSKPRGIPLPEWKDLEEGEPRVDNSVFASTGRSRKEKQNKQGNKRPCRESNCPGKVQVADGRKVYLL